MIDIYREDIFPLTEAPKRIPTLAGRRVHRATVFRWALQGLGGTRLDSFKRGGQRWTSKEALAKFFAELSRSRGSPASPPVSRPDKPNHRSPTEVDRRIKEITGQA